MYKSCIEYKGKAYPIVDMEASVGDWGNVVIGTMSLECALFPGYENGRTEPADEEAEEIDNAIYFYVDDDEIDREDLAEIVMQSTGDEFEKNKYYLMLETVDADGNIIESEMIDVHSSTSLADCLRETGWSADDAEENEQYCITEEDGEGWVNNAYYPFGTAKRPPKYTKSVMRSVRQTLDLEPEDTSYDEEINKMDEMEVFERWLQWEGIFGYTQKIKDAVDNIFYGK